MFCLNGVPIVEDLVHVSIILYDIEVVDGAMLGELARRRVGRFSNLVLQLR